MTEVEPDVGAVDAAVISPDATRIATRERAPAYDGPPLQTVWSLPAGEPRFTVRADELVFAALPGGGVIAIARTADQLRGLDPDTGAPRWTQATARTYDVAVDRGGTITALTDAHALVQWSAATGAKLRELPITTDAAVLAIADDGHTALAANTTLDLAGAAPRPLAEFSPQTSASGISARALSPDGQVVATAFADGRVLLAGRDGAARGQLADAGAQLGFAADGSLIAVRDGQVSRWDLASGRRLGAVALPAGVGPLERERYAVTGGYVVGRRDGAIAVIHPGTGAQIARVGAQTRTTELAWSADGGRLGLAGEAGGAWVWAAATGAASAVAGLERVSRLGFDAAGALVGDVPAPEPALVVVADDRVFLRDPGARAPAATAGGFRGGAAGLTGTSAGDGGGSIDGADHLRLVYSVQCLDS